MNYDQLVNELCLLLPEGENVLVIGPPGVGKTSAGFDAAKRLGWQLPMLRHPAVEENTEVRGAPWITVEEGKPRARMHPFEDLYALLTAEAPLLVMLEDVIQAPTPTQCAYMQLLGPTRCLDGKRISPHVRFMGTSNRAQDRAGGVRMIEPLKDRWGTILELAFDAAVTSEHFSSKGLDPRLGGLIRFQPDLFKWKPTPELEKTPTPRSAERFGRYLALGASEASLSGCCGPGFYAAWIGWCEVYSRVVPFENIIAAPKTAPVPKEGDCGLLYATAAMIANRVRKETAEAVATYLARLPREYQVFALSDMFQRHPNEGLTGAPGLLRLSVEYGILLKKAKQT